MINRAIINDLEFITSSNLAWETLENKTVLITGVTGFIGSYIVDVLLYLNETRALNITILAVIRDLEKAKTRYHYAMKNEKLTFIIADLSSDTFNIHEKVDIIFHAASNATPRLFGSDPVGTILPNLIGTKNLLEIARQSNAENFIYFSTSGVYGHVKQEDYPIKEECFGSLDSMDVASCYLESKRMAETMCVSWMFQYGVPVKIVRPAITYGMGVAEDDGRSFADFLWSIVRNKNIQLYTDGLVYRNFCYIADAVSGFFYVLFKGENAKAYNVASEIDITIRDLAHMLVEQVFPERALCVEFKNEATKNYLRKQFERTTVDTGKLKELGWEMHYSLDEGFRSAVQAIERSIAESHQETDI